MAEKIELVKEVYDKAQYQRTINTEFSDLGSTTITETVATQVSTDQFFQEYNDLFYDIPALGETNSHQYLIKTSGDYINFDEINEEIAALRAEISQLRQDLLNAQIENVANQVEATGDEESMAQLKSLQTQLDNITQEGIDLNTNISNQPQTSTNTSQTNTTNNQSANEYSGQNGQGSSATVSNPRGGSGFNRESINEERENNAAMGGMTGIGRSNAPNTGY